MATPTAGQTLEVTTEQMARMMEQAKKRARLIFIADIDTKANELEATVPEAARVLRQLAEEMRVPIIPPVPKRTPVAVAPAVVSGGEADPLDTVDDRVAAQEARGSALPEVQHRSDEADATALVRNLGARGKLNLPRD